MANLHMKKMLAIRSSGICKIKSQWNSTTNHKCLKIKRFTDLNVGKDVYQSESSYIVSECVKWYNNFGKKSSSGLKVKYTSIYPITKEFNF